MYSGISKYDGDERRINLVKKDCGCDKGHKQPYGTTDITAGHFPPSERQNLRDQRITHQSEESRASSQY